MNRGAPLRLYARVIVARVPHRCFRVDSRVSLLTLRPTLFGPVFPGQASALRVRSGEAICLRYLPTAFHQAGHHAGAPEADGPSFDALHQGEGHGVTFGQSHLHGRGFPGGIRGRGSATATMAATSIIIACRFVVVQFFLTFVWFPFLLALRTSFKKGGHVAMPSKMSSLKGLVCTLALGKYLYNNLHFLRAIDRRYLLSMGVDATLYRSTEIEMGFTEFHVDLQYM